MQQWFVTLKEQVWVHGKERWPTVVQDWGRPYRKKTIFELAQKRTGIGFGNTLQKKPSQAWRPKESILRGATATTVWEESYSRKCLNDQRWSFVGFSIILIKCFARATWTTLPISSRTSFKRAKWKVFSKKESGKFSFFLQTWESLLRTRILSHHRLWVASEVENRLCRAIKILLCI